MKIKNILTILALLGTIPTLAQQWPEITTDMRPGTRWWWLGSAVDTTNLTRNLSLYAQAGMGTMEITPIYGVKGNEKNYIPYLSPQWMKMLQHTQAMAAKQLMKIDMNNGTGWPFGGPEVTLEHAASCAIFTDYQIQGGQEVDMIIALDKGKNASLFTSGRKSKSEEKSLKYLQRQLPVARLASLMAYSEDGKRVVELTKKATKIENHSFQENSKAPQQDVEANRYMLRWNAPQGEWKLVALFIGKTFQKVERAAPGGEGLVIDHLSAEAVNRYFKKFDEAFESSGTTFPSAFFNDSYEVERADWTPALLREFERRRGYRLQEHFLEFLRLKAYENGTQDEKALINEEVSRRIISDYRETISDLLIENFTRPWTRWANSHGSLTRNQAHGSPANLIDTYAAVDIPECEGFGLTDFGIRGLRKDLLTRPNFSDISMLKYASSAAHLTGKKLTSSETFTWLTEHFRTSLSQCKPDMDLMFVSGVNHMFFHGTPYSPAEAMWPGWLFYASINMSPTNTIWRDAPAFFQYITRCQSFLQMGQPDNDFLVYLPIYDLWSEIPGRYVAFDIHKMDQYAPKFIQTIQTILKHGYDVDYISDVFISRTRCDNQGRLLTGDAKSTSIPYKAIIIPAVHFMDHNTLEHLFQLVRQGATVVFLENYPKDVPGYGKLEARRKEFQKLLRQLPTSDAASSLNGLSDGNAKEDKFASLKVHRLGKGRIIVGSDYQEALKQTAIPAEFMKSQYGLQAIRRSNATGHHYFISCLQTKDVEAWIPLGVKAEQAMFFDPMTGKRGWAQTRQNAKGETEVRFQLKSGQSIILQTFKEKLSNQEKTEMDDSVVNRETPQKDDKDIIPTWKYITESPISLSLNHGWKLKFTDSTPAIESEFMIDTPTPWTELNIPEANINMGTGCYTLEVSLSSLEADDYLLDLGDVRESARVIINGQEAGTVWAAPFRIPVGRFLKEGKNKIEVEVTNLPANRIAQMDREGIEWRKFHEINFVNLKYKKEKYGHWTTLPSGLNGGVKLIPVTYF